jgi:hypothetical protein
VVEISRTAVRGQPGKKFLRPPSQPMAGCGSTHLSVILSYSG